MSSTNRQPSKSTALVLASAAVAALAAVPAYSATRYWDGGTTDIAGNGNGISSGNPFGTYTGNWNTTVKNWDTGAGSAYAAWNNSNLDTAVFSNVSGTGTVTIGTGGVNLGGLSFHSNSGYTINAGTNGLNFSATSTAVRMVNAAAGTASAATISGTVGGSGNVILSSINPAVASTLTFSGTSAGGWSGTTTINAGATLALGTTTVDATSRALLNTAGITMNGGGLTLNYVTGASMDRVSDSATLAVNGGGTITIGTSLGALSETMGGVTLNSGQLNLTYVNNPSSGGTITFSGGLNRVGTTSAMTVSSSANGSWRFTGAANTAANEIVGPWATVGGQSGTAAQTDYAIFTGGNGTVAARAIAASAESTWSTTHAATSNYTLNMSTVTAATNGRLTAGRNINTLRGNTNSAAPSVVNDVTDYITMAGNDLANGDVVVSRNTTGGQLTPGRAYYVINKDGAGPGTFQVSLTPGGSAVNLTTTAAGFISAGVSLNGNTLGTYGILAGASDPLAIGGGGGSSVTLPVANVDGNLYVTNGNASVWIDAPITDNGTGKLTLVKGGTSANGSGNVTLTGNNTYTGGTVINAGTLAIGSVNNIGGAGASLTFGGIATLAPSAALNFSSGTLNVNAGAVGTITGNGATVFQTTSGSGTLVYSTDASTKSLNLGNASGFTGTLQLKLTNNANYVNGTTVQFASMGDGSGSTIQFGGGQTDSNQAVNLVFNGSSNLTFNNRAIEIIPRTGSNWNIRYNRLVNNSASATWTIATDLINRSDRAATNTTFGLAGTNTGNNVFSGSIGDSVLGSLYNAANVNGIAPLTLEKTDGGTWTISGNNTHSGGTILTGGKLNVNSATALGTGTFTWGAATLDNTSGSAITNANNNAIAWNGDGTFAATNSLNLGTGAVTLGGNRQVTITNAPGVLTIGGVIGGAFGITKGGGGTMAFTGTSSTYTGATTVNQGVLEINSIADYGANSSIGAPASGTIQLGGSTTNGTLRYAGGGSTSNRTIQVGGSTTASGNAIINNDGTGALIFTASAFNTAVASASVTRSLTLGGTTTGFVNEVQGIIANNNGTTGVVGLIKSGASTWKLSGANTYTGVTTVNGGTLLVNGSLAAASAVTVNTGATLGGDGTINGSVTVNAGGTFSPGNSPGQIDVGTLSLAGTTLMELGGTTLGTGYDSVTVATASGLTYGGSLSVVNFGLYNMDTPNVPFTYDLFAFTGTPTGSFAAVSVNSVNLVNSLGVWTGTNGGVSYSFDQGTGDLTIAVVPEPTTLGLLAMGAVGLMRRRRVA